ncbi:MAG: dethiobiotin synthase [Thermoguttaceae bacterium]
MPDHVPGLFVTGTDTEVGKTYVAALIARSLAASGYRVGVYKPAASGCWLEAGVLVSDDAVTLWEAARRPGDLQHVCPQCFAAPLAPHLAAREEGRRVDEALLRDGLKYWQDRSDIVLVEGVGGLMSPMGDDEYVADLAHDLAMPLIVVSRNVLGTINQTLQTLITASVFRDGLTVAGVVLNEFDVSEEDISRKTNRAELAARCIPPLLTEVAPDAKDFASHVDWFGLAR